MRGKTCKTANDTIEKAINEWVKEIGDKKITLAKDEKFEEVVLLVEKSHKDRMMELIEKGVDREVGNELQTIIEAIYELEKENIDDKGKIASAVDYVFKKTVREEIMSRSKRPDGRKIDQIRPITAAVGVLPRTHGSAIFNRGETQALSVATLGPSSMEQLIEVPEGEENKRYMHHYSFPPYSVGNRKNDVAQQTRSGHGALAERRLIQ